MLDLYLNEELVRKARNHRVNLSRITEQALSTILDYSETSNRTKSSKFLAEASFPKETWRAGSSAWYERRIRNSSPTHSHDEKAVDWESFEVFLEDKCCERVVKDRLRYAQKFSSDFFKGDFSELNTFSGTKRNHVLAALSALSKFLGMYEQFRRLVRNYGLKWGSSRAEDLVISRLTRANYSDVLDWVRKVRAKLPKLCVFTKFMLTTGLRYEEAINSYSLIIDLSDRGKLSDYYNDAKGILEHYRFKDTFIRRNKKVFVSFVSKKFVQEICGKEKLTRFQVDNWIKRNGLKSRFSDVREYFATHMTKWLNSSEIDFLQGRVSATCS